MSDPNLVYSGLSKSISESGHTFRIEIFRLEHEMAWTLEVVDEKGTSTVWEEPFPSDREALDEVYRTLREQGAEVFLDGGNVVPFRRR